MDESYHSLLASGIEKRFRKLEQDIEADIIRRIRKAGEITSTADWQILRYTMLGNSSEDVEKIVKKAVGGGYPETFEAYDRVVEQYYTRYKPVYEQVNQPFIPFEKNLELKQLADSLIARTNEELKNISGSLGFAIDNGHGRLVATPLSQIYNDYIDQAVVGVASGAFDYNTMIRKSVTQLTNSGLRWIDYSSGWHNRVDVAARRAILTGVSQLTQSITEYNAKTLGTDKYEVSWHPGARPSHAEWQGRVYTHAELESVCGLGTGDGLLGWNCRHSFYPFIEGISERQFSDEWLAQMDAKEAEKKEFRGKEYNTYEATQQARKMETRMRAQREKIQLLQEGGASEEDIVLAKCKYQAQMNEYHAFNKKMGLMNQEERIYADMRGKLAPTRSQYNKWLQDKEKAHTEWLRGIGASNTNLNTLARYNEARYNKTEEYQLLKGYAKAVEKGDIHVLTGFDVYTSTAKGVEERIVGMTTSDGVTLDSYATHFIDRIIGQTAEAHEKMRQGVKLEDAIQALQSTETKTRILPNGDIRRTYAGDNAFVTISVRDHRLIQANPGTRK